MKYLKEFLLIAAVSFLGEVLHEILPLPIPANIYGIVLMLALLISGVVKLNQVKDAAHFLIEIMPVMFIPAAVGLLNAWGTLKPVVIPVCIITVVSTFVVMIVTGKVTDAVIRLLRKNDINSNRKEAEHEHMAAFRAPAASSADGSD